MSTIPLTILGTLFSDEINEYLSKSRESTFATGDIESYLDDSMNWVFSTGVVYYKGVANSFSTVIDMYNYMSTNNLEVYFHNLDFDILFFMREREILKQAENEPIISSGNLIITLKLGNVTFKNSLTLLPLPLIKLVKDFLSIDDSAYFEDKANVTTIQGSTLIEYCAKDAIYLHLALIKYEYFLTRFKCKLKLTTPAIAFEIYTKYFINEDIYKWFSPINRKSFFDTGYYFGGHSEKFVSGKYVFRNVYYYDVNSLYPYIMRSTKFNNGNLIRVKPTLKKLKELISTDSLFFCEIELNIDSELLRFFPVLDEVNNINKYPFGVHKIKCSEIGIKFILKYGEYSNILSISTLLIYDEGIDFFPFADYVDTFFGIRRNEKGFNVLAKLMLNSLYGKFGEKLVRQCKYLNSTEEYPESIQVLLNEFTLSTFTEESAPYKKRFNRLDIAGKITEGARLLTAEFINQIRLNGGNVYYTDTDSIITDYQLEGSPLSHLVHDKELGKLSNEIGYKDNAIILGVKMYSFYKSGKKARKGIKKMTHDDFKDIIRGKTRFWNERFTKLFSLVDRGFFGIKIAPYEIKTLLERLD